MLDIPHLQRHLTFRNTIQISEDENPKDKHSEALTGHRYPTGIRIPYLAKTDFSHTSGFSSACSACPPEDIELAVKFVQDFKTFKIILKRNLK